MTASVPHGLDHLLGGDQLPVLLIGAGVSYGLVPLPTELMSRRDVMTQDILGAGVVINETSLYKWADKVMEALSLAGDPHPKRALARALGLLDEPSWMAHFAEPLHRTSPRHRVIARLAREGRWHAIWSLNWDCLLEVALENVGLQPRAGVPGGGGGAAPPWREWYAVAVEGSDFPSVVGTRTVSVYKPHGCVRAMRNASGPTAAAKFDRLMIGEQELEDAGRRTHATDQAFFDVFRDHIRTHPFVAAGWSASEPYLDALTKVSAPMGPRLVGDLSIVDPFPNPKHARLAEHYGLTGPDVCFRVDATSGGFTTDVFFQWVQARYAAKAIVERVHAAVRPQLLARLTKLDDVRSPDPILDWCDHFLPAWMRLCWRAGTIGAYGVDVLDFDPTVPQEHMSLRTPSLGHRRDLAMAGRLLSDLPGATKWDTARFPGAYWHPTTNEVVLPLPADPTICEMLALAPHFEAMNLRPGLVTGVSLLPVSKDGDQYEQTPRLLAHLTRLVARAAPGLVPDPTTPLSFRLPA